MIITYFDDQDITDVDNSYPVIVNPNNPTCSSNNSACVAG
jgi:hypothetical protein